MMPSCSRTPALLAALLLTLAGTGALAADKPTAAARTAARKAFERGSALYQQARYAEAAAAFEAAYEAVPNGVVHYNLGQCYEKLGELERAISSYRDYLRAVPRAEDRNSVETLVSNLEARWEAQRRPQVSVRTEPAGAAVTVDGVTRGQTPWTAPLEVGAHQLQLAREGFLSVQRSLDVRAGEPVQLELVLSPMPAPTVTRTAHPRVWTWVALGAAGAAAAGGLTYGLLARNDSRALLGGTHEQAEATALRDSALARSHTANVLYGVAGAAAVAGGVLFFVEGSF
ncbi:MAG: PEGA domain-containing protein [Myxococcaceae bacterium]|nr:PEGA domain-containing protein [Myxococcaceae bacterium]MCI0670174.1 PEGA domain-containing protein [Myxococcaceae bacterium]